MDLSLKPPPADARLLPEGRLAGPMPWVIAIMMFLTVLAAAAGLSLSAAARSLDADLSGRLTVQIVEADAARRAAQVTAVRASLARLAAVDTVREVPAKDVRALLDPWLGEDGLDDDLPVPALIDISMKRVAPGDIEMITETIRSVAPSARVDQHAQWLEPLANLLSSLKLLAIMLVGLMAGATAAVVVLTSRAALNSHRPTIEVMHLLGASDVQIARLFQRRIALDALFGGTIGLTLACLTMLVLGSRMSAIGSDMLGSMAMGISGWLIILLLPALGTALAMGVARTTVLGALRQIL